MNSDNLNKALSGDKKSLSRIISLIETEDNSVPEIMHVISPEIWNAYRIGITGPPGAGKSTITNQLTKYFRALGKKVAIIAVDPTSPFSGGALLGDRIRMTDIGNDEGVFIRSMATRGSLGGLSEKTSDTAEMLSAAGYDYILIETVGVGQSELDIANNADTTLVVLVPESGDSIQAMKAGLMEIADLFVINKSDRAGADSLETAVKSILTLKNSAETDWIPAILKTIATDNKGIKELAEQITNHRFFLEVSGLLSANRIAHTRKKVSEIVNSKIQKDFWQSDKFNLLDSGINSVLEGKLSTYELAENIIRTNSSEKLK